MVWISDTLYCDGCGVEITCKPFTAGRRVYCCEVCAAGFPCTCEERLEMDEERRAPDLQIPF